MYCIYHICLTKNQQYRCILIIFMKNTYNIILSFKSTECVMIETRKVAMSIFEPFWKSQSNSLSISQLK